MTSTMFHPEFKTASEEGDVVLLSSDGESFRLPIFALRMASTFFKSTLELPQGSQVENSSHAQGHEPTMVIPLPESSFVVESLCRLICLRSIDASVAIPHYIAAKDLLYAAEKYELHCVTSFVRAAISASRFTEEPLQLYALSCRYNWPEERKAFAMMTLDMDLTEDVHSDALRSLDNCADLLALMKLRWSRKSKFKQILDSDRFSASKSPAKCYRCSGTFTPTAWRELKWLLLDEIDRVPSGKTIRAHGFFDAPAVVPVFQIKCIHCNRTNVDKDATIAVIYTALDELPTAL